MSSRTFLKTLMLIILLSVTACTPKAEEEDEDSPSTSLADCSLNAVSSEACKVGLGVAVTTTLGTSISTWDNATGSTTVHAAIPTGFYASRAVYFDDPDLIASNITSGINIFGVVGTNTSSPHAACTDNDINVAACSTAANRYVTATAGADISGTSGSLTASIPNGFYFGKTCSMSDSSLTAGNIKSGVNIFGVVGSYAGAGGGGVTLASMAPRNPGSQVNLHVISQATATQINLSDEVAASDLPAGYRDIPDLYVDDEGELGNCAFAVRPAVNCGLTQTTVSDRIADCATQNPTSSTWDGAVQCNSGQGQWKLVSRAALNKEVWRDQRTGLLWSSLVDTSSGVNWCRASGNTQASAYSFKTSMGGAGRNLPITGNGTISSISGTWTSADAPEITFTSATAFTVTGSGCASGTTTGGLTTTAGSTVTYTKAGGCSFVLTQGSTNFANNDRIQLQTQATAASCAPAASGTLQPTAALSYCVEAAGLNNSAGETWASALYFDAKGKMGKNTSPSVRWRLPSMNDFRLAEVNGFRFVLPDAGLAGVSRFTQDASRGGEDQEYTSTVSSAERLYVYHFNSKTSNTSAVTTWRRDIGKNFRCVGRGI